jgi:hypothetical protein
MNLLKGFLKNAFRNNRLVNRLVCSGLLWLRNFRLRHTGTIRKGLPVIFTYQIDSRTPLSAWLAFVGWHLEFCSIGRTPLQIMSKNGRVEQNIEEMGKSAREVLFPVPFPPPAVSPLLPEIQSLKIDAISSPTV